MERRAFLQVGGTIGVGLVLGFRLPDARGVLPLGKRIRSLPIGKLT